MWSLIWRPPKGGLCVQKRNPRQRALVLVLEGNLPSGACCTRCNSRRLSVPSQVHRSRCSPCWCCTGQGMFAIEPCLAFSGILWRDSAGKHCIAGCGWRSDRGWRRLRCGLCARRWSRDRPTFRLGCGSRRRAGLGAAFYLAEIIPLDTFGSAFGLSSFVLGAALLHRESGSWSSAHRSRNHEQQSTERTDWMDHRGMELH
jgi:hypothetical protein